MLSVKLRKNEKILSKNHDYLFEKRGKKREQKKIKKYFELFEYELGQISVNFWLFEHEVGQKSVNFWLFLKLKRYAIHCFLYYLEYRKGYGRR